MLSLRRGTLTVSIACLFLAASASAAFADTFTVNTTADSADPGGCTTSTVCSLRDAVTAANGAPGSAIDLPAGHYTLNTGTTPLGELSLTAATTITGGGARNTVVDGNGQSRVFAFQPSTTTDTFTLSGVTVTGGSAPATATVTDPGDGGGIFSLGGLDLEHVTVSGNTAALGGGGVMDGTVHSSGAAPGPATFNGVTISGNTVTGGVGNGQGGGAVVATTLTMTNSTVAGNSVSNAGTNEGGGLVSATDGSSSVTATLVNDTITGNSVANPGPPSPSDMGGGIAGDTLAAGGPFDSVLAATNTVVANNQVDGSEQDCSTLNTTAGSSSHNIEGDATCGFSDAGSKQTATLGLGALQNNGGPTDTRLPAPSSPAVDAGDATNCPATDERGVTRPQLNGCDIGATELAPPTATTGATSAITPMSATVAGTASNPAVADGTVSFEYGTTTAYGQSASGGALAAGAAAAKSTASLSGLRPATLYHYRIVVTTTDGTATGADATFSTAAAPSPLPPPSSTPVATHTALHCSPTLVLSGQKSRCTVTVTDVSGAATPTGAVHFNVRTGTGRLQSSTCQLHGTGTRASCTVVYVAAGALGNRTVTATYAGDKSHRGGRARAMITLRGRGCGPATGSLNGMRLGPVMLGTSRTRVRAILLRYRLRTRPRMDFFCFTRSPGIRVGYLQSKTVLALSANRHYQAHGVRAGDSLASAERRVSVWISFRIGRNIWYLARDGAISYVLKVRHGQVQEIGIAALRPESDAGAALRFMESFS